MTDSSIEKARGAIYWLQDGGSPLAEAPALSEAERQRLGRISHPGRRQKFLRGRALLQLALQEMLGEPLAYGLDETGAINCGIPGYAISLSHSHLATAVGIAPGRRLGLDIEAIRERDAGAIAQARFHPAEARQLAALPPARRLSHFYRLWCLKEACAKYTRDGIFSGPLARDTRRDLAAPDAPSHYAGSHRQHMLAICCDGPVDPRLVKVEMQQGRLLPAAAGLRGAAFR